MKKILFTLVFTLFYLPLCGFSQSDIHTPNKSEPAAFKLAKVYFLPDWSDKGMSFDGTDEKPCTEVCPQKTEYDCASGQTETYTNSCGLACSRCVECYGCEAKGYTLSGCPENAFCLNDCCNNLYKLESCDNGYVSDGSSCRKETCSDNPNICTGGKTCISGSCQCPNGKVEVKGECKPATCSNKGIDCKEPTGVCNETTGQCVQCMTNSDCGGGKECNANNQCIVPDACAGVTCSGDKSCVDGTCVCPSNQVDNNGTCEAPNCANGGIDCSEGETCNKTTGKCEAADNCQTQVEAQGYTLIKNNADMVAAAKAGKTKCAFSGNIKVTDTISLETATFSDAANISKQCTRGILEAEAITFSKSLEIDSIEAQMEGLGATGTTTLILNPNGLTTIYIKRLEVASGYLTLKAMAGSYGRDEYQPNSSSNSDLFGNNIGDIEIANQSALGIGGYTYLGSVKMGSESTLYVPSGSNIIGRNYGSETNKSFIQTSGSKCTIVVGDQLKGDKTIVDANGRSIDNKSQTSISIMSATVRNVSSLSKAELFFDAKGGYTSKLQFKDRYYIGETYTYGSGNHFQCQYSVKNTITSVKQCVSMSSTSSKCGSCNAGMGDDY